MKSKITYLALVLTTLLTGCAGMTQQGNPDVYSRTQSMSPGVVVTATVVQVREVKISASERYSTIGTVVGGVAGAALANGKSSGITVLSSIVGAGVGNVLGSVVGDSKGQEIVIRLANNQLRVIVQDKSVSPVIPGQEIFVMINGVETRIIASN